MLEIQKFEIEGPLLITPKSFRDDRGFFVERYNQKAFTEAHLPTNFVQDNFSRSAPQVLRGLHYQTDPAQMKLVTCLSGTITDVVVDLRKKSPTFGQFEMFQLSGEVPQWLLIPAGFAHGFCVTSSSAADVLYKVDNYYSATGDGAIRWNDPELSIPWPIDAPLISTKDQKARSWSEFKTVNPF